MRLKVKKILTGIVIGTFIGGTIAVAATFAKISSHEKFPEGTFISGVDLSFNNIDEAANALDDKISPLLSTPITITLVDKSKETTLENLGVKPLIYESLQEVETLKAGEQNIIDVMSSNSVEIKEYPLKINIDQEVLNQTLESHFEISKLSPKPAKITISDKGEIEITEEKSGLAVDQDHLLDQLNEIFSNLENPLLKNIEIALSESEPTITKKDLEPQKQKLKEKLEKKITLVDPIYSDDWEVRLIDHLNWVELEEKAKITVPYLDEEVFVDSFGDQESLEMVIHINQDELDKFIDEEISEWLDKEPDNVNIYTDENGEVVIEGHGVDGKKIQRSSLKKAIELAVANNISKLEIPVLTIPSELTISQDLQEKGITDRISVGHTSYYGSPANRVFNIKLGAEQFNGHIVAPGETMSFNNILGPVDGSTGYRKELVIKREGTIPEYGGGICQVSTTMYRAILLSGLPVAERHEHSYAVSYYSQILGHGLDATIYIGGPDLKFTNDTDGHILIQTYVDDDYELYITFYGTPTGRTVELEGPYLSNYHGAGPTIYEETDTLPEGATKQVQGYHQGFDALWYRHITDSEGNITTEPIETNYRATPIKILVGAGEA